MKPAARTAARPWPAFRGDNAAGNGDGQGAVDRVECRGRQQRPVENADPGLHDREPDRLGRQGLRRHGGQQRRATRRSAPALRRRRAGRGSVRAHLEDLLPRQGDRKDPLGADRVRRPAQGEAASQVDAGQLDAGDRRHPRHRDVRHRSASLAAWDMNGKPLWKQDVGVLDSGWFFDPTYQWGHSSSPIIYKGQVIVQADIQKNSFIAAYDVKTGKQLWRTGPRRDLVVGHADRLQRQPDRDQRPDRAGLRSRDRQDGLDARAELRGHGRHAGGRRRPDLHHRRLPAGAADLRGPADRQRRHLAAEGNRRRATPLPGATPRGTYIPTPLYYDGILYTCNNDGVLTAYDGEERRLASTAPGSAAAARSPPRRLPPTASSTSPTRTAT